MGLFSQPETALLWIILAYLLGAIPFGLLFARWLTGKDPRQHGSGNIGATNALRTGGKTVGILTLLADIAKGSLPVALALHWQNDVHVVAGVALAAFLGHIFPVYLKFKGGKGVATMFGVLIPWAPWVAVLAFAGWLLVFKLSRYVSLASVVAGVLLPVLAWLLGQTLTQYALAPNDLDVVLVCVVLATLMIVRHIGNMQRLMRGDEPKTGGGT